MRSACVGVRILQVRLLEFREMYVYILSDIYTLRNTAAPRGFLENRQMAAPVGIPRSASILCIPHLVLSFSRKSRRGEGRYTAEFFVILWRDRIGASESSLFA